MAVSMDALLRIKADVQGEGAVQGLTNKLGGLARAGDGVSKGFKGLAGSAGGLVGGLQTLVPLASGAGLVALANNSINAADHMFDLAQKSGMSVESLSQLGKAAKISGSDVEAVATASVKLSKGLVDGKAADTLKELGISATDASGKLKPTSQVMLEVADKFKAMPDGATKSAAAVALFGRAGADLIPMLNMGSAEIGKFSKMSGDYAKKANDFGDKLDMLQMKVGALGGKIGVALLPFLESATNALVGLVDGFNKLPGPLQTVIGLAAAIVIAWGPVTGVISTVVAIFTTLGPAIAGIGATIGGWAGIVGPAMAAITAAFSGLLAFLSGTVLPTLLAFFSGPVGWTVLAIAAVVAMCVAFREPIGKFLAWVGQAFANGWKVITQAFNTYVAKPIGDAWNALAQMLPNAMQRAANFVQGVWTGMINAVKGVVRVLLQYVADKINAVGTLVNVLINGFNRLPGPIKIPVVPMLTVPAFAAGGVVNGATMALVGEAGREYIIPESKMGAASASYLSGARGAAVLNGSGGGSAPTINITTGPVVELDGKRYVSMEDLERAMRVTAEGVIGRLRTPSARIALGVA